MTDTVSKQIAYVPLVSRYLNVSKQVAYVPVVRKFLEVSCQVAYIPVFNTSPIMTRRRQVTITSS